MKYLALSIALLTSPLAGECLNCIELDYQHESGKTTEIVRKKCGALQRHIRGKVCPGCKCPRDKHTKRLHEYAYHQGRRLPAKNLGTVDVGSLAG